MLQVVDVLPALPEQSAPPKAGAGNVQVLAFLVLVPPPHDTGQVFHGFQADQAKKVKV